MTTTPDTPGSDTPGPDTPGKQALIEAARAYEGLFVPALFRQWAVQVADAARIKPGQNVLDVACGTGVLSREVASRVTSSGRVTAIDPGPGMVMVARELAPGIDVREGVAESLPFPDRSFDAVVSQFGLMFFTDRRQALREMARVVRPGGRLVVAVWDALESMPAYAAVAAMIERTAGRPAADALRAPFVLGDRKALAALFAEAGLPSAEITTRSGEAHFPSIRIMVEADLRGWLPLVGINLGEDQIARTLDEAAKVLAPYAGADGRVTFGLSVHVVATSITPT